MNILKEFPSEYITAADVAAARQAGKHATLTIKAVVKETARNPKTGEDAALPVLTFEGTPKRLRLNKSSISLLVHAWGAETDAWVGKPVDLHIIETNLADKITKERKLGVLVKPSKAGTPHG